jgi:hypothetical protein
MVAARLRAQGLEPSDVGPGKGCPAALDVVSDGVHVTVIGGEERGCCWLATWEDADDDSFPVALYEPSASLSAVRRTIAEALDSDARASEVQWMTFKEWAARGAR